MNFERGKDIRSSIRIGRCKERVFKDIKEAAEWCVEYPEEYTKGIVSSWFGINPETKNTYYNAAKSQFNHEALRKGNETTGKLQMVKWIKENLHFSAHPEAVIGLKDSKMIIDLTEELVGVKIFSEKYNISETEFSVLTSMMDRKIKEIESWDRDPDAPVPDQYISGFKDAFVEIKRMIKMIKHMDDETKSSRARESQ